jgi:DNA recombination protein RmuC
MQNIAILITLAASLITLAVVVFVLIRVAGSHAALEREFREELQRSREESRGSARELREELAGGLRSANETTFRAFEGMGRAIKELSDSNQQALDRIRNTFDQRVRDLAEGNEKKQDEMRKTVDEKLHETLERRLGESFKLVSDRLEAVQRGLGEMQSLASGVTDLRKVLGNVKTRGIWAEVQLGAILEQILNPDQYEKNVAVVPQTTERVEFAVKLPGPRGDRSACVWLPIDSKFPQEDYLRLIEASERGDVEAVMVATDGLARAVRLAARDIHDKYISPPHTTDFAIMFLGSEGLYAEVLRNSALMDDLSRKYRIVTAGPTTLAAILSSLRMGFQTLAIEQRAVEVWRTLAAIKTEFAKFGETLDRVQKQLDTASRTIEQTGQRSRAMERKLRAVESLPEDQARDVLGLAGLEADLSDPEPEPTDSEE